MRRSIGLFALLAVIATSGCGGSANRDNPYYAATSVRHQALSQKDKGAMVRQLSDLVEGRQIIWVDPSGKTRKIQPKGEGLGAMALAPLHAVWMASEDKYLGAELDMMVTTKGQSRTPVSVMVGLKGDIKVISAPEGGPRALPDPPDRDALRSRYGIGLWTRPAAVLGTRRGFRRSIWRCRG